MPVRAKNVNFLVDRFIGGQWFKFGEVQSMPQADYDAVVEFANELYDRLIHYTDWERVMLEASGRCAALEHDHGRDACPESVEIALRIDDRPFYGTSDGIYGWKDAEANLAPVVYDQRGWSLPKELSSMFAGWARARRKSIKNHKEA